MHVLNRNFFFFQPLFHTGYLTAFSEEEKVGGDPRQISRDYSLLNEICIYKTETTFFKLEKQMRYKTPNISLGIKRSN